MRTKEIKCLGNTYTAERFYFFRIFREKKKKLDKTPFTCRAGYYEYIQYILLHGHYTGS